MTARVDEVAPDLFRISAFHPDYGIQFNQFLIRDDEPTLFHTGFRSAFEQTRAAVAKVIDPTTLRWIGYSHFESDECGALNHWLAASPRATAIASFVGVTVNLADAADRPARALADNEVLVTGRRRLRFLATPQFPHGWDAGLLFEETERTLLCSDLFFHPADPEPLIERGIVDRARDAILQGRDGPLAHDMPFTASTLPTMERLAALAPGTLALMHGSTYRGDGQRAIRELATVLDETLGPNATGR